MKFFRSFLAMAVVTAFLATSVFADDPKPEEIFAKHLDSIGTKEARAGLTNLIAQATGVFEASTVKGGAGVVVASDRSNYLFMMNLNSPTYPFERIGWFDSKVDIPIPSGLKRGLLGSFVQEHSGILDSGLFGGVMSARWALYKADVKSLKARSGGKKKVGDRNCYVVFVVPKGGETQLTVKLYFDAETFQHLRTDYRLEVPVGATTIGQQNQQMFSIVDLTEAFSDFHEVDGLQLPFTYKVSFMSNSNAAGNSTWTVLVSNYLLNQKLKDGFFKFPPAG